MQKKSTKIIATIGPASDSEEKIEEFIKLGVDILRFNFKHSDLNWHKERLNRVAKVSEKIKLNVATLLDLQGPEIRLSMPFDQITLRENEKISLSDDIFTTKDKGFCLSDSNLINFLKDGQEILADNGLFVFEVKKEKDKTYLISKSEGILKNRKAVNILNFDYKFPVIHEKDREGLVLAKENGINFIALSFVRDATDIKILRQEMKKNNLTSKVVAKIETAKALENIDEIIEETDAVMIARGDLGVEIPAEQVPFYQKSIIKKCMQKGIPVITATQMLESMIEKPIPTRAEVSDVANAVYDFTDAVMLSGETASGKHPLKAVKTMIKVTSFTEQKTKLKDIRLTFDFDLSGKTQMICDSAFNLYKVSQSRNEDIKGFIIFTQTGKTARMISRYKPHVPIFAFCPNLEMAKTLYMSFGVISIPQKSLNRKSEIVKEDISNALDYLKENGIASKGDSFIILHGDYWTSEAEISTIRIVTY